MAQVMSDSGEEEGNSSANTAEKRHERRFLVEFSVCDERLLTRGCNKVTNPSDGDNDGGGKALRHRLYNQV